MTEGPEERQPFATWLEEHARGTLNDEVTAALAEVVQAVSDRGKAGKVVLEIIIEPAGSQGRTVAIGGKVTAKPPTPAPELGVYYPDVSGGLHRDDPYQQRIPGVRVVDPETGVTRVTTEDEGEGGA